MNAKEIKNLIAEQNEDALFIDGCNGDKDAFNEALIGWGSRCGSETVAIYDQEEVINILAEDMEYEEAEEWFGYNIAGSYMGQNTPMFVCDLRKPPFI